jgi:hypothetical protein
MSKTKLPARVDGEARPESREVPPGQFSELVEIAKRCGDFSKHYGPLLGACLYLCSVNAASGRRPFLWGGLTTLGALAGSWALKHWLPGLR